MKRSSRIRITVFAALAAFAATFWILSRQTEAVDYVAEQVMPALTPPAWSM